jgi:AcrR family transcriptional regulator
MAGLREKKKKNREERILNAAIELFGTKGYEKTTIEDIASASDLGVGTIYNYYSSKEKILLSIIKNTADENKLDEYIYGNSKNFEKSFSKLIESYFQSFLRFPRQIWREVLRATFGKQPDLLKMIESIDSLFIKKTVELLGKFDSPLKKEAKVLFAKTVYSILFYHILIYLSDDDKQIDDIKISLKKQISLVMKGI